MGVYINEALLSLNSSKSGPILDSMLFRFSFEIVKYITIRIAGETNKNTINTIANIDETFASLVANES